ncbi:MAG: acyl carrier protein [Methylococcales bacterium]|nr:acyl carrier protein [Methylococcales bacterium]MDD5630509.1 acyl carrier protein [Methylococcales bacterium]
MKKKLKNFIFTELIYHEDPASFGEDANLLEAGLDSMGIMRLIMYAEQEFDVTLPDTEIEPDNVKSLNALEKWIRHACQSQ